MSIRLTVYIHENDMTYDQRFWSCWTLFSNASIMIAVTWSENIELMALYIGFLNLYWRVKSTSQRFSFLDGAMFHSVCNLSKSVWVKDSAITLECGTQWSLQSNFSSTFFQPIWIPALEGFPDGSRLVMYDVSTKGMNFPYSSTFETTSNMSCGLQNMVFETVNVWTSFLPAKLKNVLRGTTFSCALSDTFKVGMYMDSWFVVWKEDQFHLCEMINLTA